MTRYVNGMKKINNIELLMPFEPDKYVYWMFGVRCDSRDDLMIYLKSKGVATGCHYTPLHMQPLFKDFKSDCPIVEREYPRFMTLPFHAALQNEEVDYVLKMLSDYTKK